MCACACKRHKKFFGDPLYTPLWCWTSIMWIHMISPWLRDTVSRKWFVYIRLNPTGLVFDHKICLQNVRTTCTWSLTWKPPPSFCLVALNRGFGDESWSAPVRIKGRKTTGVGAAKNESYVYCVHIFMWCAYICIYISFFDVTNLAILAHRHACALGVCVCVRMSCLK